MWKHSVIPVATVATLVVAVLVFLFGTDVIGRLGGIGMPGEPDSDSATTEPSERGPRLHATYSFKKGTVRSSENHQRSRWLPERHGRPGGGDQPAGFAGQQPLLR